MVVGCGGCLSNSMLMIKKWSAGHLGDALRAQVNTVKHLTCQIVYTGCKCVTSPCETA